MFVDALATNRQESQIYCLQLICTSESSEAISTRVMASLSNKSPPPTPSPSSINGGLALVDWLTLTTERSFGSIGQQGLVDVRLDNHR